MLNNLLLTMINFSIVIEGEEYKKAVEDMRYMQSPLIGLPFDDVNKLFEENPVKQIKKVKKTKKSKKKKRQQRRANQEQN